MKSGQFVNTARVDPGLLVVENSRLCIRDKKSPAICIMTGTLTESFVVDSCESGPRHAPYLVHKVTIAPLEQDWRRDVSVWGFLFDFHTIAGMLSESGFGFATRGEGKGDSWKNTGMFRSCLQFPIINYTLPASAPSSPTKNRPSSSVLTYSVTRTADSNHSMFSTSRSYDDRSKFQFSYY